MAVNKNFVVKNGLEVNTDLILANADTTQVGIATTALEYTLHVNGGVGATDSYVSAASTVIGNFQVGTGGTVFSVDPVSEIGSVGVGTASPAYLLDVRSPVSTGQTALYVQGDVRITGDLNIDDITLDDATLEDLTVTKTINVTGDGTLNVTGITTLASSGGITTTGGDLYVGGDLYAGRNLNITGITTATDKEIYNQFDITNNGSGYYEFAATGIGFTQATSNPTLYIQRGKNYRFSVNASGHPFYIKTVSSTGTGNAYEDGVTNNGAAVGIITFKVPYNAPDILYYNCQYHSSMNGEIRVGGAGAGVGVGSEGTFIGAGATMIDFKTTTGTSINSVDINAGIATVTIQPGVSIGLAIALGG